MIVCSIELNDVLILVRAQISIQNMVFLSYESNLEISTLPCLASIKIAAALLKILTFCDHDMNVAEFWS